MPQTLWFFIAFVIVLALIGLAAWLVRRFGGGNLGSNAGRGRLPRLAVIDAAAVDGRRKLVLVRRDNVEHLLMIGGPTDVVVEPNIVRGVPQRDQAPTRGPAGTELPPAPRLAPDNGWADGDAFEHREPPIPELPPRARRPAYADEPRRASPPIADRGDLLANFAPEPLVRSDAPLRNEPPARAIPRSERAEPLPPRMPRPSEAAPKAPNIAPGLAPLSGPPPRPATRAPAPPPVSSADQNLADMAQRLEAALRRPGSEPRPDAGETRGPSVAPAGPSVTPEATVNRPPPPPRAESAPRESAPPAPAKAPFENLEDEMASLLGRPKPPA